jgi:hypothetical protein
MTREQFHRDVYLPALKERWLARLELYGLVVVLLVVYLMLAVLVGHRVGVFS